MTKFSFPTHHIDLLPAALVAKLHQYGELDTKRRALTKAVTAAEYAIVVAAKADTATRAAKLLGDKKAGEPNAEATARVTLAGLQQELSAYTVAVTTVTAECRALAFSHKAEIRSAVADATDAAHARAVAAVDTLDAALTELSELASMTEWTDTDFARLKGAGRPPLITEAFLSLRTLLAPPATEPAKARLIVELADAEDVA